METDAVSVTIILAAINPMVNFIIQISSTNCRNFHSYWSLSVYFGVAADVCSVQWFSTRGSGPH